jgi:serine/threonine protein kinase
VELDLAVKVLKNRNPDQEEAKMFLSEVEAGIRARHPCLCQIVSWNMFEYKIAMERGVVKLGDVIECENHGMPYSFTKTDGTIVQWDDTKRAICAFGIAAGMCYLHKHGIIHRDLKSENVMLDENLYPKICDFGLSKVLNSGEELANRIYTMTLNVGTPIYMAPEIFTGEGATQGKYSPAVDVYAYAMVLYEIALGTKPWGAPTYKGEPMGKFNLQRWVHGGERPTFPGTISPAYKQLIEACWTQNPDGRPTFEQIVEQTNDDTLTLPATDEEEFSEFRERVVAALKGN